MEESIRMNRRTRPRPPDLRRKVLLKNFLREQMTHIPETRLALATQNSDSNFVENSSESVEFHENLRDLNDENKSSTTSMLNTQACSNSSKSDSDSSLQTDSNHNSVNDTENDVNSVDISDHESKMFKFPNLIRLRKAPIKKVRGIVKAKEVRKTVQNTLKSRSVKNSIGRIFHKRRIDKPLQNQKSKSFFSLFKSRKEQKSLKELDKIKNSQPVDYKSNGSIKCNTLNQSVQTDESWNRDELGKIQESNKLLQEENRLLSESLSYFVSNVTLGRQMNVVNSRVFYKPNKNITGLQRTSSCYSNLSTNGSNYDKWNPRSKILRSKSVQEHSDRRNISRNNYRTRSINFHNNRSSFAFDVTSPAPMHNTQYPKTNFPRAKRQSILSNYPVNTTNRVQRRSSMPERILLENDRSRICRRSESVRESRRKPFNCLPSEAFY